MAPGRVRMLLGAVALTAGALACGDNTAVDAGAAPIDARLIPDAAPPDADTRPLPDLVVDRDRLRADLAIEHRSFAADACELLPEEGCIAAAGDRTLLRFAVETPNLGNTNLELGDPAGNPAFQYSACHDHYHYKGFADFQLVDADGNAVATGHKQAFCLMDTYKVSDDPTVAAGPKYHCGFQGIQRGWSDVYDTRLPCQFVDITDTPPGNYTLRIELNHDQTLEELSYANDTVEVPVTLGDPDLTTPTEACDQTLSNHALEGPHRECGWTKQQTLTCTPGQLYRVGCSTCANIGTCTGNPMLRICDPANPDPNCSFPAALAFNDDTCDACPRTRDVPCPDSGQLDVYTAPSVPGGSYTCNLAIIQQ